MTSSVARWGAYDRLLPTLLFLTIVLTCGLTPMQGDTWWQLRAGKDMWLSRAVLLQDTYSHTAYGAFWPNHEWLSELLFYAAFKLGGLPLLTLFATALIAGGWAFTWALTRGPVRRAFLWTALALICSAGWWEPRPHAFSLLFLPATVFLLALDRHWYLPLMFVMWANCHGGILLGFVVLAAGLLVQTLIDSRRWRRSVLVALGCTLAATATPLGFSFWTEIPKSLVRINQYTLDEWTRPSLTELPMAPFWTIAGGFLISLMRLRGRLSSTGRAEATLHGCALILLPAALSAVRNVGPFAMIAVPALTHLWSTHGAPGELVAPRRKADKAIVNLSVIILAGLGVLLTLTLAYHQRWSRLKWTPLSEPALNALSNCPDNVYNRYDEGGMLLWFSPGRRVFLDGRQDPFPAVLVLEHIEMENGGRDYRETFARHNIHCAFLPVFSPVARRLSQERWTQLHRDDKWVVLAR